MPTLAEMKMLGDALDDLSGTFQRNRAMSAQERRDKAREELERMQLEDNRTYRKGQLEAEATEAKDRAANRASYLENQRQRNAESTAHEGRLEAYQKQMLEKQETQAAIAGLEKQFELLERGVREGSIDSKEANRRAKAMVGAIKQGPSLILRQTPFAALLDGEADLFTSPQKKKGRVVYKPDPNDPEGPLIPTVSQDLDEAEMQDLLRKTGQRQPAPPPEPPPSRLDKIKDALKGPVGEAAGKALRLGTAATTLGASEVPGLIRRLLSGDQAAGTNAPPESATAGLPPPAVAPGGTPKPTDKTDAQLLQEAAAAIRQKPEARAAIERRLREWGIDPKQIPNNMP
jgi:hypothetical protein